MLEYKCDHAGIVFKEVNEAYTTQTCSNCGSRPRFKSERIRRPWNKRMDLQCVWCHARTRRQRRQEPSRARA